MNGFSICLFLQFVSSAVAADQILFQDDFKSQLGPGWSWRRENPKTWRVSRQGLEVRIEPGNMWGPQNDAKNVLLRPTPDPLPAELIFSVTVSNQPTHQYEQTDLAWYYDDSHMVKLGQEMVDGKVSIVMGREEKDKTRTIVIIPLAAATVRLQLLVKGDRIHGRFREGESQEWREAGECDLPVLAGVKPRLSLQFYQGAPEVEHWTRVTEFVVTKPGP